jgi:hypothetical protein
LEYLHAAHPGALGDEEAKEYPYCTALKMHIHKIAEQVPAKSPPHPVTQIRLKSHPHVTFSFPRFRNLVPMRGAFVVRLARETNPFEDHFEGSVEEVDSGKELKFRSSAELVTFLGECFQAAIRDTPRDDPFIASEIKPEADAQSNNLRSSNALSRRRSP